ncbi:MAG: AhpC/TSA family protein [Bryobacterales bacterium]|jgi:hypothetical protein|nr:AhpC/TSA family protein [Bryobacterales bacterium]
MANVTVDREEIPERGKCLRSFRYVTVDGAEKLLSDFKGSRNLALIVADGPESPILNTVAGIYQEILDQETHVIAILKCSRQEAVRARDARRWPFEVSVDETGALHRELGAEDPTGAVGAAVYLTDRWAEVFFVSRTIAGDPTPTAADLLEWLAFINYQCPECFASEWHG